MAETASLTAKTLKRSPRAEDTREINKNARHDNAIISKSYQVTVSQSLKHQPRCASWFGTTSSSPASASSTCSCSSCGLLESLVQLSKNLQYMLLRACVVACLCCAIAIFVLALMHHDLFRALPGECAPASILCLRNCRGEL